MAWELSLLAGLWMSPLAARRWRRPSLTPVTLAPVTLAPVTLAPVTLALIFTLHRADRLATGSIAHADLH